MVSFATRKLPSNVTCGTIGKVGNSYFKLFAEQLYPLAVLMEEMKSEDAETRINAMRRLSTVAEALGPERTRKELIPFLGGAYRTIRRVVHPRFLHACVAVLCSDQMEDDDEVLLVMATELGKFTPLVGGVYESVCLISVLGFLAMVEETVVRDKARFFYWCILPI